MVIYSLQYSSAVPQRFAEAPDGELLVQVPQGRLGKRQGGELSLLVDDMEDRNHHLIPASPARRSQELPEWEHYDHNDGLLKSRGAHVLRAYATQYGAEVLKGLELVSAQECMRDRQVDNIERREFTKALERARTQG